uniref:60S ribosomal protein L15 n=1 Tax=Arundo donax TaxID=35708 RepID=A0A0A9B267_ARUDO
MADAAACGGGGREMECAKKPGVWVGHEVILRRWARRGRRMC